jgi:peptidyl-prolyl cis-trans isomerase SurA
MNRLLASFLFLALLATGHVQAQSLALDSVDSIVAVVDDDVILRSELDRAVANIREQFASRPEQLPPQASLERQVLERLILMRLQLARAEGAGVRIGDLELESAISRIAERNNLSMEQMRAQLSVEGTSYDEFRQQLREELTVQRMRQSISQSRVAVSDTEVDIALASESLKQGEVHLGLLLVALPDGATSEQITTAQTKIEGIRKLVDNGEMEFATAAVRYSDHQTALEGGDLGWRRYDEIPPLFANLVQGMSAGQVSQPLRGPSGYSLIKLIETRDAQAAKSITEYHTRGILVSKTEVVSSDEAKAKAQALHARLVAGEDFAKVAKEASDDVVTRNQGGDMGWFQAQAWGTSVGNALMALQDEQISEPFESEAGWHIIQRLGSREQDVTEESRRNAARESIGRRKADEEYDRFLRQLRDEAYIDNRLTSS